MNSVKLTVITGSDIGATYLFLEPDTVYIGRGRDCNIVFPIKTVSRFHCMLDINPPFVTVRDFGSLNGTYVNNKLIGKRAKNQSVTEAQKQCAALLPIYNGDQLRLGPDCEIKFEITCDLKCKHCGKQISIAPGGFLEKSPGDYYCEQCMHLEQNSQKLEIVETSKAQLQEHLESFPGYKTIRRIGSGGMGEVWLVEELGSGKTYAIKKMLPRIDTDKNACKSFLREAALSAQLNHNNIVKHYSYHQDENGLYIIMEYCSGGSVDNYIRENKKLYTTKSALDCIIQVLDGLAFAHSQTIETKLDNDNSIIAHGIVHRDLKPSNIFIQLVDNQTVYKVADFGLAKAFEIAGLSGHTKAGQIAGTPLFMPRQQVLNFRYAKPEIDVWAAAASLYFMLTGHCPKQDGQKDPWLLAVSGCAIPILDRNKHLPKQLANAIDTALIDSPEIQVKTAIDFKNMIMNIYQEVI